MKENSGITWIIAFLCVFIAVLSVQNMQAIKRVGQAAYIKLQTVTVDTTDMDRISRELQERIDKLDEIIAEYERVKIENTVADSYIKGFWDFMEREYNLNGHQDWYLETHK